MGAGKGQRQGSSKEDQQQANCCSCCCCVPLLSLTVYALAYHLLVHSFPPPAPTRHKGSEKRQGGTRWTQGKMRRGEKQITTPTRVYCFFGPAGACRPFPCTPAFFLEAENALTGGWHGQSLGIKGTTVGFWPCIIMGGCLQMIHLAGV